ncbi:monocarboxylate transporter 12-like [Mizuhopecten yessoensis]|uniref:Monocarboxylate transporter 12 n=1 Tax=Mizuhopecten yessoensis TaxID=6573 RepID=A0A210QL26_MIZYE|nr:monocarboxylate transporter 12-like [Mizuhopecten yessoensis]OWF49448.1 Monocarboxylate transporter 12 [Mizuhopecten yessoensis]
MANRREKTPVDSGYAWVILFACSLLYMMLSGLTKAFGILYTEFLEEYDAGAGNTAWIGSVKLFLFFGLGPLANHLCEDFSFRKVVITGGLLIFLGYLVSVFVEQMELLYLTIGVVAGFGCGFVFAPCATIVSFYFKKRQALANGIVISGSGLGSFIFPYFYRFIIDEFGLHGALLIISAVALHICVGGALLRQPQQLAKFKHSLDTVDEETTDLNYQESSKNTAKPSKQKAKFVIDFSLFKIPRFSVYVAAFTINIIGYAGNFSVFPAHVKSLGFSEQQVAIALSMIGATEMFARIFFGWFADKKIVEKKTIVIFSAAVSGASAILIPFLRNFPAMVVYGCIVGIFPGAFWSLMAVMMLECVELERLTSAMGVLSMFMSFGIVISQPVMGWIEDATGSWDLSFRIMGMFNLLSGVLFVLEPVFKKIMHSGINSTDHNTGEEIELPDQAKEIEVTYPANDGSSLKAESSQERLSLISCEGTALTELGSNNGKF